MLFNTLRDEVAMPSRSKRRAIAALAITIVLGIASRKVRVGYYLFDKSLGDVLYGVAAYLAFAISLNTSSPRTAALACVGCWLVESFKLTGIPASYRHVPIVPWVLGREFSWHNVLCYPVGVLVAIVVDLHGLRATSSRDRDEGREPARTI